MQQNAEILPIKSFRELLTWQKSHCRKPSTLCRRSQPISGQMWHESDQSFSSLTPVNMVDVPRTIFCHDLRGGYLSDRFVNGTECEVQPYTFLNWSCIDTFIYFSHNFVTIPPMGWTECAHTHGVKMLGTIITEWDDGSKLCSEILEDDKMEQFVSKCVKIMQVEQFDGWLLNIENALTKNQVPQMVQLVKKLTRAVHEVNSDGQVIWYDSVTNEGKLDWQNELNEKNKIFFDNCDGIFINYTWKVDENTNNLQSSLDALEDSGRQFDIYVGIDAFGRGCFGGGGFQCNLAFEKVREKNMSVALFAPSWTYEAADKYCSDSFPIRENAFWKLLQPYMFLRGPIINTLSDCTQATRIFSTTFNPGCFINTRAKVTIPEEVSNKWHLDLSIQQYQPPFQSSLQWPQDVKRSTDRDFDFLVDLENGQGLIINHERNQINFESITFPLLICQLPLKGMKLMAVLTYTTEAITAGDGIVNLVYLAKKNQERRVCTAILLKQEDDVMSLLNIGQSNQHFAFNIADDCDVIEAFGIVVPNQLPVKISSFSIFQCT